jgi:YHS domain-containing protein
MKKPIFLFLFAFIAGAAIALVIRTARYEPKPAPAPAAAVLPAVEEHSSHQHAAKPPAPAAGGPTVNSVCAICGMDVDPSLPTAVFEGKTVGFGCKACPAKFKADPAQYGPYALKNKVIP